jgi:hypothetical protein
MRACEIILLPVPVVDEEAVDESFDELPPPVVVDIDDEAVTGDK